MGAGRSIGQCIFWYDFNIVATLKWGQGEALANVYFGYDFNIVAANASPLQIMG